MLSDPLLGSLFNKNKKIISLATAIIIVIVIALSFLPLNDGHILASFPLSAEPVFAQPFGQAFPYGEEQGVPTLPSSPSTMDFGMFMNSFANSIFNETSTFAGAGTSIVDGVEVSGISLDKSQNELSVTLSRTAAQGEGINNNITSADTNTNIAPLSVSNSSSIAVIAMRIPISTSDILSIVAASSPSSSSLNALDEGMGDSTTESQLSSFSSDSFNPFSLLSSLQIGSSVLIDPDWSEPQTVTMDLIGGRTEQKQQPDSSGATRADFVLVSVIPYTGVGNNTISSTLS